MKKIRYIKWLLLASTTSGLLTFFTIYNSLQKANNKAIKIDYSNADINNGYSIKGNLKSGIGKSIALPKIIQNDPHNDYFKFHGQTFDTDEVTSYYVQVVDSKNTTCVIYSGWMHQFNENIADANKDYDYLQSIMPNIGKGLIFNFHGQSFDITKINSFDVQVIDNKNTTLTINDGQKHQFKQDLNVSNSDYDFLESIMLGRGQGVNFNFHGQSFNIKSIYSYDLSIVDNKNTILTIDDGQKHQFKQSLDDSNKDYAFLQSIVPSKGQGKNFNFHGQSFDTTIINSYDVQVIDNKNTILTIDDGQKHQFKQSLDDSNKDYAFLQSIMLTKGQGENFIIHNESFDLVKVVSYDVQVIDNKNTTLTINDGQKHQFNQNLDDSNKDFAFLQSIMPTKGQGENFNFHGQSFDLRKVNSFDVQVIDNKNTILTIDDGQKHQFKQSLNDSNKDYDYLSSITLTKGQGENFKFHDKLFDITKIVSYDVQFNDNKKTTLTINDGQKHQFNQNLDDSNKDYAFLQSIMPSKGQGENFKFHGQSFDLAKVVSYDVQVIDNKNTILTIDDGQKHQFKQSLDDSYKDYDYLSSIMPTKEQGENFKFHDQSFDITKIVSYNVQVIDVNNAILTINDGQKHQFTENLADANKDYAFLQSIMPTKGQGKNFIIHNVSFDLAKVNSFDVQVIDNKNTILTIDDGQKHQFNQNLDDSNKDFAFLQSIMPTKGQGENFKFHDQSFDITKIASYNVQVIDVNNAILTINDGQKHQFTENLADANKNYAFLQSIMPTKGQGEGFKIHGDTYNLDKINYFGVRVIDPGFAILTINDGQDHIYKEKLSQSKSDYAYLSSITTNDGKGINYFDWNLIELPSILLSIVLLIGLLVIGLETTRRRRSLNNKNHNINVKKPSFEYRNPNLQLKNTNFGVDSLNLESNKPKFEYRNFNFQLNKMNSWSNKPKLKFIKPDLEYRNPDINMEN
ncbi:MAG: hypothetical protein ACRCW6_01225 [Mycoplasmoidaceae bacterium]